MTRKQAESYGYSIIGGYRTVREALEHIEQSMEVA